MDADNTFVTFLWLYAKKTVICLPFVSYVLIGHPTCITV